MEGGKSLGAMAKVLNESNIPTKNGGIWRANTVRKILNRK
ncbi:MAG: recombinase family protein [Spirochaetia bacterium]|nr:recombinase family protein [Spirochaetia bacterium]